MHELSIAMSILEIAEEESERRGDARITAVHLKLGPLSGVVKEALQSAYELAREMSSVKDARLVVEEVPIVVRCGACGTESTGVSVQNLCCSACGEPTGDVVGGRQLEIVAMEIEE